MEFGCRVSETIERNINFFMGIGYNPNKMLYICNIKHTLL